MNIRQCRARWLIMAEARAESRSAHASTSWARSVRMKALYGLARGALLRSDETAAAAYLQNALAVHDTDASDGDSPSEQAAQGLARATFGWLLFEQGKAEVRPLRSPWLLHR